MEDCHTDSELLTQFHKNTPQLRFSGFDDDWEEKKLGEIVTEFKNPVELPHNGYTRLGIRSHAKGTFHEYVAPGHELEAAQMSEVKADNLIMSITFAWEHAVAITDKNDEGKLVSQRFPQFSFNKGQVPEFYKYVIADEKFRHHLWLSSPGGAGRNRVLNIKESMEYKSHIPSSDFEQQKIGTFLSHVDSLIQAKTKKLENLKSVKKSLLQKCFPKTDEKVPEMRFAGFSGNWEEKKLGEVAEISSGTTPSRMNSENFSGDICWLTSGELKSHYIYDTSEKINESIAETMRTYKKGTVVIAIYGLEAAGIRGTCSILKRDCTISQACMAFSNLKSVHNEFLYCWYIANGNEIGTKYAQGTKQQNLSSDIVSDMSICFPTLAEQQKIGHFFSKYDSLISAQQKEIDKLKDIKKSLLQKMFV